MTTQTTLERSAVNAFTAAGATVGVTVGFYLVRSWWGVDDPATLFTLIGLCAMPFAAVSWLLVARAFRQGTPATRRLLAWSGWVAWIAAIALMILAARQVFPPASASDLPQSRQS